MKFSGETCMLLGMCRGYGELVLRLKPLMRNGYESDNEFVHFLLDL